MLALPETEAAIVSGTGAFRGRSEAVSPAYACGLLGRSGAPCPERAANRVKRQVTNAILTKRNSVVISKGSKKLKNVRTALENTAKIRRLPSGIPQVAGGSSRCFEQQFEMVAGPRNQALSHENASFSKAVLPLSIWLEISLVGAAEGKSQREIDSRPPTAPVRND